jgi:hypothetical protein
VHRRAELEDGIVDLVCGAGLVAWGAMMYADLGGLGAIPFAVMLPMAMNLRKRLVTPRIGHVRLEARGRRRRVSLTAGLFTLTLLGGVGMLFAFEGEAAAWKERLQELGDVVFGLMLALVATVLGLVYRAPRAHLYAAAAVASFLAFHVIGPIEGVHGLVLPVVATGVVPLLVGGALLARFLRRHPSPDGPPEDLFDSANGTA